MGKNKKLLYVIIIAVAVIIPVMMEHNIIFKQSKYIYLLLCLIGIYTIVPSGLDIVWSCRVLLHWCLRNRFAYTS